MTDAEFKMHFITLYNAINELNREIDDFENNYLDVIGVDERVKHIAFESRTKEKAYIIAESLNECLPRFAEMGDKDIDVFNKWVNRFYNQDVAHNGFEWLLIEFQLIRLRRCKTIENDWGMPYKLAMARFDAVLSLHGIDVEEVKSRAGRNREEFKDYIIPKKVKPENVDLFIKKMHEELEGKKGIEAAKVIAAAMELGYIRRPSYAAVTNEFGKVIAKIYFNAYLPTKETSRREDIFCDEVLGPIKNRLKI